MPNQASFFKDYPLEALATTSVLFGSMIQYELVRGFVLDVALRIILNFAAEGPESKMFKFAVQAIFTFRARLNEFPQYCQDLLQKVPGIQAQADIYQAVLAASVQADTSTTSDREKPKQVELIRLKYFSIDEVPPTIPQENPPKDVVEKILFIVNNITMDNFETKISDLRQALLPNYFSWFSTYLVVQRAKTEPNYHKLYSRVMTGIGSEILHDYMLNVTLKQLYALLAIKDVQMVDKKHLKNLAAWLGNITLAIDRPIRHRQVAMREMLLDSYQTQRLEVVVPFVCKVLQQAADSKIFRPPNPWTVGILRVLLELNEKANWKLSLTFEVEVLMKDFNLKMKDIKPTNILNTPEITEKISGSVGNLTLEQQQIEHQRQGMLLQQHQQQMMILQQRQQRMVSGAISEQVPFAGEAATVNENPFANLLGQTIFVTHPDLKEAFQKALRMAVREILIPSVEKASSIAVTTASRIVMKDFATEADEMKLKAAAITMVGHLGQSLVRATCIDSLKESIRSATQALLPNMGNIPQITGEELDMAINDNISIALRILEKATMDKSIQDIGEVLVQPITIRRYHNERRSDQPFIEPNTNPYALSLPDPLGLKSTGVTAQQFKIYEDFGKFILPHEVQGIPHQQAMHQQLQQRQQQVLNAQMNQNQQNMVSQPQQAGINMQNQLQQQQPNIQKQAAMPHPQPQGATVPGSLPSNIAQVELEQSHRRLVTLMDALVSLMKEHAGKETLDNLAEQNQIRTIIYQILTFIAKNQQRDQLALKVSQAVVNSLFGASDDVLCREVLSTLLEKLCSLSLVARKDVIWWLVYALDSRKFNVPVIKSLLSVNLIDVSELDTVLVTAMENKMENATKFAIDLIKDTVLSDEPILMRMDFVKSLEFLSSLDEEDVKNFFSEYESMKILPTSKNIETTSTERYYLVFTEWVRLLQRVTSDDKIIFVFIKQLMDKGVLSDSDNFIGFVKAALELSVYSFKESDPTGEVFTAIDALSKLLIKLFILQDFAGYSRQEYLNTVFSIILLVFSNDHEEDEATFNERPYFRLLSNFLCEWATLRGHNFIKVADQKTRKELLSFDAEFYNIFASYLHSFQPFAFPGFSFAWISLLSHRMFLPVMLRLPQKAGWEKLMLLLIDLLKFLNQYTIKGKISDAVSVVYKGTLRIFLGISNDVPQFLIENHYELMNNLPISYFQLKNVILSAIPLKMLVPNPFDSDLALENITECQNPPVVFYDPVSDIQASFEKASG